MEEDFLVFLDETGDHSLQHIDKEYPIFALGAMVCKREDYIKVINPSFDELKYKYWGKRHVVFHSTCIRKSKDEFKILRNPLIREPFFNQLNYNIVNNPYRIIISAVDKFNHNLQYVDPANPYNLTLEFIMERTFFLVGRPFNGQKKCVFIAESRDHADNERLYDTFQKLKKRGTQFVNASELSFISDLRFVKKDENEIGHQIVDLCLYPTARTLLTSSIHPSMPYVYKKLYMKPSGGPIGYGLKFFPTGIEKSLIEDLKKASNALDNKSESS